MQRIRAILLGGAGGDGVMATSNSDLSPNPWPGHPPRYAGHARIKGMLTQAADELPDAPLYYNLHDLCKTLKCTPPKTELFRSAIINAGYR